MMRPGLFANVLAVLFVLGCEAPDIAPVAGLGDPYLPPFNNPQISLLSPELQPWLGFHPAIIIDDGKRPMQVQVPVRNLTDRQYLIDYRILFYDADEMELAPAMGWTMAALRPKQIVRLKAKALTTDAASYRLEVKWAR